MNFNEWAQPYYGGKMATKLKLSPLPNFHFLDTADRQNCYKAYNGQNGQFSQIHIKFSPPPPSQ